MAYSNDFDQIDSGFVSYLGALYKSMPDTISKKNKLHYIFAKVLQNLFNFSKDNNIYVYKPVLKACSYLLKNEAKKMQPDKEFTGDIIEQYLTVADLLDKIIVQIKED